MDWITTPEAWVALLTLTVLELVLGIDNIVFITILVGKLPKEQQRKARNIGLLVAMGSRVLLLFCIGWVMGLEDDLFTILDSDFSARCGLEPVAISVRDLILIVGGLFLLAKATHEIHHKLEGDHAVSSKSVAASFTGVIVQILILDVVFSLDSVITAVGMAKDVGVMVTAVIISVFVMLLCARPIGDFVESHPTVKLLALSFLILIGVALLGEGLEFHIPKGYIYFAMGFSVLVEMLNLRLAKKAGSVVGLKEPYLEGSGPGAD